MIMKEKVEALKKDLTSSLKEIKTSQELSELKVEYLGKKGRITELSSMIKTLSDQEKKEFGKHLNEIKTFANQAIDEKNKSLEMALLNKKLESEKIDVTLPGTSIKCGSPNMLEGLIEAFTKYKLLKRSYRCLLSLCFNNIHIHSVNSVTLENPD